MAADEPTIDAQAPESAAQGGGADATDGAGDTTMTHVRTAQDATDNVALARSPENEDAKLDVALDETFPTSDAPSNTQPGKGMDPAPSSGFDAEAEKARMAARE